MSSTCDAPSKPAGPTASANVAKGMIWASVAGLCFVLLNTVMRQMAIDMPPVQALFLRYAAGALVWLPWLIRDGPRQYKSNFFLGQLARGVVHTAGLAIWFTALPHLPLAYTTAIGFTGPIFIMLGASWFLGERMVAARWIAVGLGFVGVLVIVGPKLGAGNAVYSLLMLAAAPVFAGSFLIAKMLTRHDRPEVIVFWQSVWVSLLSLPFAFWLWVEPSPIQWAWVLVAGMLGSLGHWCLTRAYVIADISAAQPVKFLDLVWATGMGFIIFGDTPAVATLLGGALIVIGTIWAARREAAARLPLQSAVHSNPPKGDDS
ncbi:MAG: DMT family transporter [Burkholderiaceae bacterium]